MRYRRARVPGGTYFFTVNLAERKRTLLVDHIDDLRNAVRKVLTDHLHAVWKLPEGDADYSMRWSLIKAGFLRCLPADERRSRSRHADERSRFYERLPGSAGRFRSGNTVSLKAI